MVQSPTQPPQSFAAHDLTLSEVEAKFKLRENQDPTFFNEWCENLPPLSEGDRTALDQIRRHFLYLSKHPMSEEAVKLVVLSPLLALAGFYDSPYRIQTEASVRIELTDEDTIVRGRIDILVLQEQLWIVVVESKEQGFSLNTALPQALTYMGMGLLNNINSNKPIFGFATNGSEFLFLKAAHPGQPEYALSDLLTLRRRESELPIVLGALRNLGELCKTA
jgi:predicted type IV restriction endonuclease